MAIDPKAPPVSSVARARSWLAGDRLWVVALAVVLVADLFYFSIPVAGFYGGGTGLLALTEQFLDIGAISLGLAMVILAGEIDLSVGAMSSLIGIIMAELWVHGVNIWLATLIALAFAAIGGAINGFIVTRFQINSLLVTLATQFIFGSLATAIGGETPPYGFPDAFSKFFGTGTIGPIPYQLLEFIVLAVFVGLLIARTRWGRSLVLIGYNRDAARYTGIKINRTVFQAFIMSGLLAGIAGIFVSGYYNAARDDIGDSLLLPGVTMVVLGGVSIFGGKGRITGVVLATFVLGFLTEGLLVDGDSSLSTTLIQGVVLILGLMLKIWMDRKSGISLRENLRRRFSRLGSSVALRRT